MTTNKPEVMAWRWRKPIVNDQGETVGATAWELGDAPEFLPWWTNEPLIRLSDYESLQAEYEKLFKHLQNLIDQTTPLEPEPGNPMWSRRIQLDEVMAERDQLRAENKALRKDAERYRWLRRGGNDDIGVVMGFDGIDCGSTPVAYTYEEGLCGERMDAAIDDAMETTQ